METGGLGEFEYENMGRWDSQKLPESLSKGGRLVWMLGNENMGTVLERSRRANTINISNHLSFHISSAIQRQNNFVDN